MQVKQAICDYFVDVHGYRMEATAYLSETRRIIKVYSVDHYHSAYRAYRIEIAFQEHIMFELWVPTLYPFRVILEYANPSSLEILEWLVQETKAIIETTSAPNKAYSVKNQLYKFCVFQGIANNYHEQIKVTS